jgi:hypothetical protein
MIQSDKNRAKPGFFTPLLAGEADKCVESFVGLQSDVVLNAGDCVGLKSDLRQAYPGGGLGVGLQAALLLARSLVCKQRQYCLAGR